MRIWYQSMSEIDRYSAYRDSVKIRAASVLPTGGEIEVHGVRAGTYGGRAPVEILRYPYAYHMLLGQILDNVLAAEDDGFDAIALGSYSEPFLREARSIVDIPVASMAESTLLVACSVGRRFGIVTVSPEIADMTERIVAHHQLSSRLAGISFLTPSLNETDLAAALSNPGHTADQFRAVSEQLVRRGADVIIPGEGVLNEVMVRAGVSEVEGASVMDTVAVTILHAQLLASLAASTGLRAGRRWEYPKPDASVFEVVRLFRNSAPFDT